MTLTPTSIAVPSGRLIDLMGLKPDDIDLFDITKTLAGVNRWNGWHGKFYSVASHSLLVGKMFLDKHQDATGEELAASLMHDAQEAYIGDMASPAKRAMREIAIRSDSHFDELEALVCAAINERFQLPEVDFTASDAMALKLESWALFDCDFDPEWRQPIPDCRSLTIDDALVVPEKRSWAALHHAVECCLAKRSRKLPAIDFWREAFGERRAA